MLWLGLCGFVVLLLLIFLAMQYVPPYMLDIRNATPEKIEGASVHVTFQYQDKDGDIVIDDSDSYKLPPVNGNASHLLFFSHFITDRPDDKYDQITVRYRTGWCVREAEAWNRLKASEDKWLIYRFVPNKIVLPDEPACRVPEKTSDNNSAPMPPVFDIPAWLRR